MNLSRTLIALTGAVVVSCSGPKPANAPEKAAPAPVRITQFYATNPKLAKGEQELLCYGVENAVSVWLSPPRQELSAALSRCVEVKPTGATTYTLTARGADGGEVSQQATVTLGAARVHIVEVRVSSLNVRRGDAVSICYKVQNATSVGIAPVGFTGGAKSENCTIQNPQQTTTYVVTATGADGSSDRERVTVNVR